MREKYNAAEKSLCMQLDCWVRVQGIMLMNHISIPAQGDRNYIASQRLIPGRTLSLSSSKCQAYRLVTTKYNAANPGHIPVLVLVRLISGLRGSCCYKTT
jgi:hypothetical protein